MPEQVVTQPPNPELSHSLPQPGLKNIGRPLLLRNNTYSGSTQTHLFAFSIYRAEATDLSAGPHKRRHKRLIIDTVARDKEIKAWVFSCAGGTHTFRLQRARLISLPIERCERDISHGVCGFICRPEFGLGLLFRFLVRAKTQGRGRRIGFKICAEQLAHVFLISRDVVMHRGSKGESDER